MPENNSINDTAITPDIIHHQPNEAELPPQIKPTVWSGYTDASVSDVIKDLIVGAADIAGLGGLLDYPLQRGQYSPEERLKEQQFQWLIKEIYKISEKLNQLYKDLPSEELPEASDVAAILEAAINVSKKTANFEKRRLLRNGLVNSFSLEQYRNGLTLRLFFILEGIEYGDVVLLRRIDTHSSEKNKYPWSKDLLSLEYHHLEILEKFGLVAIWNRPTDKLLGATLTEGSTRFGITELGKSFLKFVCESSDEDQE